MDGHCSWCAQDVPLNDDGTCFLGHPATVVSDQHEPEPPAPQPEADPAVAEPYSDVEAVGAPPFVAASAPESAPEQTFAKQETPLPLPQPPMPRQAESVPTPASPHMAALHPQVAPESHTPTVPPPEAAPPPPAVQPVQAMPYPPMPQPDPALAAITDVQTQQPPPAPLEFDSPAQAAPVSQSPADAERAEQGWEASPGPDGIPLYAERPPYPAPAQPSEVIASLPPAHSVTSDSLTGALPQDLVDDDATNPGLFPEWATQTPTTLATAAGQSGPARSGPAVALPPAENAPLGAHHRASPLPPPIPANIPAPPGPTPAGPTLAHEAPQPPPSMRAPIASAPYAAEPTVMPDSAIGPPEAIQSQLASGPLPTPSVEVGSTQSLPQGPIEPAPYLPVPAYEYPESVAPVPADYEGSIETHTVPTEAAHDAVTAPDDSKPANVRQWILVGVLVVVVAVAALMKFALGIF